MPLSRVAALRALVHKPYMPGLVFLPASSRGISQDAARCPKSFRRRALPGHVQNQRGAHEKVRAHWLSHRRTPCGARACQGISFTKGYVLYRCTKMQRGIPWHGFCQESHLSAE